MCFAAASGVVGFDLARGGLQLDRVGGALGARAKDVDFPRGLSSDMNTNRDRNQKDRDEEHKTRIGRGTMIPEGPLETIMESRRHHRVNQTLQTMLIMIYQQQMKILGSGQKPIYIVFVHLIAISNCCLVELVAGDPLYCRIDFNKQ